MQDVLLTSVYSQTGISNLQFLILNIYQVKIICFEKLLGTRILSICRKINLVLVEIHCKRTLTCYLLENADIKTVIPLCKFLLISYYCDCPINFSGCRNQNKHHSDCVKRTLNLLIGSTKDDLSMTGKKGKKNALISLNFMQPIVFPVHDSSSIPKLNLNPILGDAVLQE